MRGCPPVQLVIIGLAFAALAVPLVYLTSGRVDHVYEHEEHHDDHDHSDDTKIVKGGTEHPEGEHKHVEVPSLIRIRYAHQPLAVSLKQEDREILVKPDLSKSPLEIKAMIEVSHEGNEMILTTTWPQGTPPTALTVEIEPDGFETRGQTRWSDDGRLDEVITFQW